MTTPAVAPSDARRAPPRGEAPARRSTLPALMLGALGVVFGDIGTSPLYALQIVFALGGGAVRPTPGDVYGVVSLVFWAITLIVSVKYIALVMRADNQGEGGILALTALVQRATANVRVRTGVLVSLGVFGAALLYGDSVITPAISVLSAVEGLEVAAPALSNLVVPVALAVLCPLFALQRWGTAAVGRVFGPVMVVWFVAIGVVGAIEVAAHPGVARGLSPAYAVEFVAAHPGLAFVAMGAVMLAITGAEALYADMGHFGRRPIRRAWFALPFGALTLNYLGQSGLILRQPDAITSPFFLLVPDGVRIPMVMLATAATVIASQAVISGAFSVSRQAAQLGYLPRRFRSESRPRRRARLSRACPASPGFVSKPARFCSVEQGSFGLLKAVESGSGSHLAGDAQGTCGQGSGAGGRNRVVVTCGQRPVD